MKQLALNIEQMKHLQELGLDISDASMYWFVDGDFMQLMLINQNDILDKIDNYKRIPAYTLQDVLNKLPHTLFGYCLQIDKTDDNKYSIYYYCSFENNVDSIGSHYEQVGETLLEAAYKMLVWCLENKNC